MEGTASASISIDADVLASFLRKIYDGFDTSHEIEPSIWREVLRVINSATVEGLAQSDNRSLSDDFLSALRHSNEVFAAFKVHQMGSDMAAKLLDANGHLKPFRQWLNDVSSISTHHCGAWLRTEYDTAVIRAHNAADWQSFLRNKDVMPNLRWMPTTSPNPESSHRKFWEKKLTLPVDDPFWTKHHPGDRWNCKCSLEATDEPVNRPDDLDGVDPPQRGLENNPGKDGHTFSDNHPYFPDSCRSCFANKELKNKLKGLFRNAIKNCYSCPLIDNKMKNAADKIKKSYDVPPPSVETYNPSHNGKVMISPYHGDNEVQENKRLGAFVADKLGKTVYLLPRLDPESHRFAHLRQTLLPIGVKTNKNPDYYIGGMLFDGKSMMGLKRSGNDKKYHNAILNHIKSAKKQADNVVLEIPNFVSRRVIGKTINGYMKQSSKGRIIIVKHGNKCYVYK